MLTVRVLYESQISTLCMCYIIRTLVYFCMCITNWKDPLMELERTGTFLLLLILSLSGSVVLCLSVCLSVTFIHCCNSLMYLSFSSPNKVGPIVLCLSQQIRDVNESRKTRESVFYRSKEMNLLNSENWERLTIMPVAPRLVDWSHASMHSVMTTAIGNWPCRDNAKL